MTTQERARKSEVELLETLLQMEARPHMFGLDFSNPEDVVLQQISFFVQGFQCGASAKTEQTLNQRLSSLLSTRHGWSSESGAIGRIAWEFRDRRGALQFFFDLVRELQKSLADQSTTTAEDRKAPTPEIEEFALTLVKQVRDESIRSCDRTLDPSAVGVIAQRWRGLNLVAPETQILIADVVDEVVFYLLQAIDQGALQLKYISSTGREVDLVEDGMGELGGWYAGSPGWKEWYSKERISDNYADLRR
jgi:hypothetical protein